MYLLMMVLMRFFVKLLKIPKNYLLPLILLMCMVGAITTNNRVFDAWVLYIVGLIGYVLIRCGLGVAPMVLGFILGRVVESNFRTGVLSGKGSLTGLFQSPLALAMIVLGIFMTVIAGRTKKKREVYDNRVKRDNDNRGN